MNRSSATFELVRTNCVIRGEIERSGDTVLLYDGDSERPFAVLQWDPNAPGLLFNSYGFEGQKGYSDVHGRACVYIPDK